MDKAAGLLNKHCIQSSTCSFPHHGCGGEVSADDEDVRGPGAWVRVTAKIKNKNSRFKHPAIPSNPDSIAYRVIKKEVSVASN